jgi:hypothetical protein
MSTAGHSELQSFSGYVTSLIASGKANVSPEVALLQWRLENLSPEERDEEVRAIQEALDDIAAGDRGTPADEFLAEINAEFSMPPRS